MIEIEIKGVNYPSTIAQIARVLSLCFEVKTSINNSYRKPWTEDKITYQLYIKATSPTPWLGTLAKLCKNHFSELPVLTKGDLHPHERSLFSKVDHYAFYLRSTLIKALRLAAASPDPMLREYSEIHQHLIPDPPEKFDEIPRLYLTETPEPQKS